MRAAVTEAEFKTYVLKTKSPQKRGKQTVFTFLSNFLTGTFTIIVSPTDAACQMSVNAKFWV